MTKNKFIEQLTEQIKDIPEVSRNEIIADYEEHFTAGIESGKTEDDIIAKLGDPITVAKDIKSYWLVKKAEKEKSPSNLLRAIFATLGLSFLNLILLIGPLLAIGITLITLFGSSIVLAVGGFITLGATLIRSSIPSIDIGVNSLSAILISLGVVSFGIFFFMLTCYLSKGFYYLMIKYLKFNINIITKTKGK